MSSEHPCPHNNLCKDYLHLHIEKEINKSQRDFSKNAEVAIRELEGKDFIHKNESRIKTHLIWLLPILLIIILAFAFTFYMSGHEKSGATLLGTSVLGVIISCVKLPYKYSFSGSGGTAEQK